MGVTSIKCGKNLIVTNNLGSRERGTAVRGLLRGVDLPCIHGQNLGQIETRDRFETRHVEPACIK